MNGTVVIIGRPSTTADAQGAFTVSGVTTPYTIATEAPNNGMSYITIIVGVTRSDPTIVAFFSSATSNTGTVTGSLNATTFANRQTRVLYDAPETARGALVTTDPYSIPLVWYNTASTTGTVYGLQWANDTSGLPMTYDGWGSVANVTVSNGATTGMENIALNSVTSAVIGGTLTAPVGITPSYKTLTLRMPYDATTVLVNETSSTASWFYNAPVISNATFDMNALGQDALGHRIASITKHGLSPGNTAVGLTLPSPPQLSLPLDMATGIDLGTQVFSWAPMVPGGLYEVSVHAGIRQFVILTADPNFVLPPTVELGIGTFPTNTPITWSLFAYGGGVSTTDDVTASVTGFFTGLSPTTGDVWSSQTDSWSFTTD